MKKTKTEIKHFIAGFLVATMVSLVTFSDQLHEVVQNIQTEVIPSELVDLVNDEREYQNLRPLSVSEKLTQAAQLKADHMAENGYFAHSSPEEGYTPWHWFRQVDYDYLYAGENLAIRFTHSENVHAAWMASVGHRTNIVNPVFNEIGIATAVGEYKGEEVTFVVQLLGRPMPNFNNFD